eukprot:tig00021435_g21406.t1
MQNALDYGGLPMRLSVSKAPSSNSSGASPPLPQGGYSSGGAVNLCSSVLSQPTFTTSPLISQLSADSTSEAATSVPGSIASSLPTTPGTSAASPSNSAPSHGPQLHPVGGERILNCGTRLRATLFTEHTHMQTGEPFFVGGNQSKIVPFRVDIDVPRISRSTRSFRPNVLETDLHDEKGALIPFYVLKMRGQDVTTVPFQYWLVAEDFSGAPVRVEVGGQPGRAWSSGEIPARITPLSSKTGKLSLVLRPPFDERNAGDWTVTVPNILSAARHDLGKPKKHREGAANRPPKAAGSANKRKAEPPDERVPSVPIKVQKGSPTPPPDEPAFVLAGTSHFVLPAGVPSLVRLFVTQTVGRSAGVGISACLVSLEDETRTTGLRPAATPGGPPAATLEGDLWGQTFEIEMPPGGYAVQACVNGVPAPPATDSPVTVLFCSLGIAHPHAGQAIPGRVVPFQIALAGPREASGLDLCCRLYLSDGRVLDAGRDAEVHFAAYGPHWAKVELVDALNGAAAPGSQATIASAALGPWQCAPPRPFCPAPPLPS